MVEESSNNSQEKPLLTFNSLYNILRTEKKSHTLQKFPDLFYEALDDFIQNKKSEIKRYKQEKNQEKLKKEELILKNTNNIVKELVALRTQKIAKIATQNSLYDEKILEEEYILDKEKELYDSICKNIKNIQKFK